MFDIEEYKELIKCSFQLDTNRLNGKGSLPYMNQLEKWYDNCVIHIEICSTTGKEAELSNFHPLIKKARSYIFSESAITSPEEIDMFYKINKIINPNNYKSMYNDVDILFTAQKYYNILVTNDGGSVRQPKGILGCRDELKVLKIEVMRDSEAVEYVKNKLKARDNQILKLYNDGYIKSLPEWYGNYYTL